jgi:hypothetical protein
MAVVIKCYPTEIREDAVTGLDTRHPPDSRYPQMGSGFSYGQSKRATVARVFPREV